MKNIAKAIAAASGTAAAGTMTAAAENGVSGAEVVVIVLTAIGVGFGTWATPDGRQRVLE